MRSFSDRCVEGMKKPLRQEMSAFLSSASGDGASGGAGTTWTMPCVSMLWISIVPFGRSVVT